ncbi:ropporin-1-like [Chanos chanos]|uniref:Ropporin-1-like n=1 Tax=Chanos chanos TaxID=29144 RepID=A0A6J2W086_CHACN|nr:ropporin-1-like [Chanos chanos]
MSDMRKQIRIPPELPEILKQFTKDAIRTQPEDLIEWAALYFNALVQGQPLPVREVADRVFTSCCMDLSPETLHAMHSQMCGKGKVSKQEIEQVWKSYCLAEDLLRHILLVGRYGDEVDWMKFFALSCNYLGGTIKNAMIRACYILNDDPACRSSDAHIPFELFRSLYIYLASMDKEVTQAQSQRALTYLETQAKASDGVVKVSDFINGRKVHLG